MTLKVEIKKHILSPAQERAFTDLAAGMTYEEIAARHHRTTETVKSHAKVIRETLHAKSMIEAVAKAVAQGIITITEVGGKTMIACALVVASGFLDDHDVMRHARNTRTRVERRIDEA